jgi:hypothetical protein
MTTLVFRKKNKQLVDAAVEILKAEQPMTLRQLFYRLLSAGKLTTAKKEYKRLGTVLTRLREAGAVPRNWLVDHTRSTLKPSSWSGLSDFAETVREAYRKDFWASLPHHVEVFVEKDAVAGTIQPVTEDYDVSLRVCRGYASVSFAGEIADFWRRIKKPIFAYYLGDFDPSGFDIERDLHEKLSRYSGRECEYDPATASNFRFIWCRLGVTADDFGKHNLVRLPVKKKDKRAPGFISQYGTSCAEIDAIPPTELRRRVKEAIVQHIDDDEWQRLLVVEEAEQESLERMVKRLGRSAE